MKKRINTRYLWSFYIILSIFILVLGVHFVKKLHAQMNNPYMKDVIDMKSRAMKDVDTINKQMKEIREMIVKKNLKFQVKLTDAIKYEIGVITGSKTPKDLDTEVKVQNKRAEMLWGYYLNRYGSLIQKNETTKDKPVPQKQKTDIYNSPDPNAGAFNWRDRGDLTPVKNQKQCGCCWAFASAAVVEANFIIRNKQSLDLSEQHMIDCAIDRYGRKAGSCNGGWYGKVFDFLSSKSANMERNSPYTASDKYCIGSTYTNFKVAAWGYVGTMGNIPSVNSMKQALCKYGPLAACVKVTPAFQAYAGGVFDEHAYVSGPRDINHAIVIVGWDDSKKSYLIKNSWGTSWGDNGFMWIEYGTNNIGFGSAWVVVAR